MDMSRCGFFLESHRKLDDKPLPKVLVILGTTGVGKTKLSVQLAKRFNGEVISADSMQIYDALPIATNQVTKQEMEGIPHYFVGEVSFKETDYNVFKFQQAALPLIENILGGGKLPIIVGGTNQFIEALMWETPIFQEIFEREEKELPAGTDLYAQLCAVDPERAQKLHPNDKRRVKRALETGKKASEYLQSSGKPKERFDLCIIWLQCPTKVLLPRLDKRVDSMVLDGLLNEAQRFYKVLKETGTPIDCTQGLLQCIGWKELVPYLQYSEESTKHEVLDSCLASLKSATHKYAKNQVQWITSQLLPRCSTNIYTLDSGCVLQVQGGKPDDGEQKWDTCVLDPAKDIVAHHLHQTPLRGLYNFIEPSTGEISGGWEKFHCEDCNCTLNGQHEWTIHLKCKRHKNIKASRAKRKTQEEARQKMADAKTLPKDENMQKYSSLHS